MKQIFDRIARRYGYIPVVEATAAVADAAHDVAQLEAVKDAVTMERDQLAKAHTGQTRIVGVLLEELAKTKLVA